MVERIVDGDTIWVRVDDAIEGGSMPANATKVRLLEIDAPEATSTRECGGNMATAFVRKTTPVGTEVWLQADVEDTDRYGRFLRYVWLDDRRMLNRLLARRGWAEAVLYEPNDLHWRRMRAAERKARTKGRGVWGELCAPEPEPEPAPAPAPELEPKPAPEPDAACHPSYEPCVPSLQTSTARAALATAPSTPDRCALPVPTSTGSTRTVTASGARTIESRASGRGRSKSSIF